MNFMTLLLALGFPLLAGANLLTTPTREVWQSLRYEDDMDLNNLELALDRQLESFARAPLTGRIRFGGQVFPRTILKDSAEELRRIVRETRACLVTVVEKQSCWNMFSNVMNARFHVFAPIPGRNEPGYGSAETTLFTAYFSPDLIGSRTQSERFKHPIYALPTEESLRTQTREAIDFDRVLSGKGLELVWVEDSLFDLYILHVEGGGRVHLVHEDGSEEFRYLSYAGANGRRGPFLSRHLVERGYFPSVPSMREQRRFLEQNPNLHREVYSSYGAYVFFKETDQEPHGVANIPLTEGRSVAVDSTIYSQPGMITFVQADKAVLDDQDQPQMVPFSRIFVSQDTGSAIRGNARCDLYMGFGRQAAHAASSMKTQGKQFFLIKK
jgi:membrane-bound lytic murein transglycosylase A